MLKFLLPADVNSVREVFENFFLTSRVYYRDDSGHPKHVFPILILPAFLPFVSSGLEHELRRDGVTCATMPASCVRFFTRLPPVPRLLGTYEHGVTRVLRRMQREDVELKRAQGSVKLLLDFLGVLYLNMVHSRFSVATNVVAVAIYTIRV